MTSRSGRRARLRGVTAYTVHAIEPDELDRVRRGLDDHGNLVEEFVSEGDDQLRCCLRLSQAGESLLVMAHAPLTSRRPWAEVGPVFVHALECRPRQHRAGLPEFIGDAPRVLRSYTAEGDLYYRGIRVTAAGENVDAVLSRLFDDPEVAQVHVRNLAAQCFILRVTRPATAR